MKQRIKYYTSWRIMYTIYWAIDAYWWPFGNHFPRLYNWLQDRMDSVGIRMGFLLPYQDDETGETQP